jgi:hypothetical protein
MGVDNGIGSTLREARKRRRIDLSEVESATKIRLRYLRAIENEEWDVLPGGAYTRAFIRTYATHLGLDGERLADEFRRDAATGGADLIPQGDAAPIRRLPRRPGRLTRRSWTVVASLGVVALLVAIALAIGGGGSSPAPAPKHHGKLAREKARSKAAAARPGVALRVQAEAEVWVCLLDGAGEPLIDGQILEGGAEEGPFRSGSYTVSFGNGEVTMLIDGRRTEIPPSSSPVGYRINSTGELRPLGEAERPTCT